MAVDVSDRSFCNAPKFFDAVGEAVRNRLPSSSDVTYRTTQRVTCRSSLASNAVVVPVEAVGIVADDGEVSERDIPAVKVRRRWRDAHRWVGGIAVTASAPATVALGVVVYAAT
jgi:hypothetical protein